MARRAKGTKQRLSRESIVRGGIAFVDAHGVAKLNMRMLAKELGSPVMTLYTYIRDKDELLEAMVDRVAAEIALPDPDTAWRDAITEIAVSAHRTLYRHPWVNAFWPLATGPAKMKHQESILRVLREAGFSVKLACRGYHAITMHAIGFTMQALDFPRDATSMKAAAGAFLAEADAERFPYFVEHVRFHHENPEPDGEFQFVLSIILDGLERLLEES